MFKHQTRKIGCWNLGVSPELGAWNLDLQLLIQNLCQAIPQSAICNPQ